MIRITETEVWGFRGAFRGMRNPLKSWDKSDSHVYDPETDKDKPLIAEWIRKFGFGAGFTIGPDDMKLACNLAKGGSSERKYLRMIHVQCDIDASTYWLAELDTYKVATTRNSTSLQHTGASRDFEISDFYIDENELENALKNPPRIESETDDEYAYRRICWKNRLDEINFYRKKYKETKDYAWFIEMRTAMPQGFMYLITFDCNYEVLMNMYYQRKNHRLPDWDTFCSWILELPYIREFIGMKQEISA